MPSLLKCEIRNSESGDSRVIPLLNTVASWPKWVGSGPDCEIRIEDSRVAPRHLRVVAGGRHFMVEPLEGLEARFQGMSIRSLEMTRVDEYEFEIGPYRLRVFFVDALDA